LDEGGFDMTLFALQYKALNAWVVVRDMSYRVLGEDELIKDGGDIAIFDTAREARTVAAQHAFLRLTEAVPHPNILPGVAGSWRTPRGGFVLMGDDGEFVVRVLPNGCRDNAPIRFPTRAAARAACPATHSVFSSTGFDAAEDPAEAQTPQELYAIAVLKGEFNGEVLGWVTRNRWNSLDYMVSTDVVPSTFASKRLAQENADALGLPTTVVPYSENWNDIKYVPTSLSEKKKAKEGMRWIIAGRGTRGEWIVARSHMGVRGLGDLDERSIEQLSFTDREVAIRRLDHLCKTRLHDEWEIFVYENDLQEFKDRLRKRRYRGRVAAGSESGRTKSSEPNVLNLVGARAQTKRYIEMEAATPPGGLDPQKWLAWLVQMTEGPIIDPRTDQRSLDENVRRHNITQLVTAARKDPSLVKLPETAQRGRHNPFERRR
jgi:hypothetical protein